MAMATPQLKALPTEKPLETKVQQVPIDAIFVAEFKALGTNMNHQRTVFDAYDEYANGLMNCVRTWLNGRDITTVGEKGLFEFLSEVFHKDFEASFKVNNLLVTSIDDNKFNCYSSTVLMADVLTRLGKPVTIVLPAGHVLLRGEEFAFETTAVNIADAAFPIKELDSKYPHRFEAGAGGLLAIAHGWCGTKLLNAGRHEDAISEYTKQVELSPRDAGAWSNKGNALDAMGKYEDALSAYEKALEADPLHAGAWYNMALTLHRMERDEDAVSAFDKALEINPKNAEAWTSRGVVLSKLGRHEEALKSHDTALELDPEFDRAMMNRIAALSRLRK